MTLFLVQNVDAKLENKDPSDPWGEWRTRMVECGSKWIRSGTAEK